MPCLLPRLCSEGPWIDRRSGRLRFKQQARSKVMMMQELLAAWHHVIPLPVRKVLLASFDLTQQQSGNSARRISSERVDSLRRSSVESNRYGKVGQFESPADDDVLAEQATGGVAAERARGASAPATTGGGFGNSGGVSLGGLRPSLVGCSPASQPPWVPQGFPILKDRPLFLHVWMLHAPCTTPARALYPRLRAHQS